MYLTQSLHRNIQQRGDSVAGVYGTDTVNYREFGDRVARMASVLRDLGVDDGDCVAMMSLNSMWYLQYLMAVPWAGGVLNPVNTRWSADEVAYSLDDSNSRVLLVDDAFLALVDAIRDRSECLTTVVYVGSQGAPEGMLDFGVLMEDASPIEDRVRRGNDLAGIFYTGGTTGFPKGVMLSHNNLCSSAIGLMAGGVAPEGAVFLHAAPMFHLADLGMLNAGFIRGIAHVMVPSFDAVAVASAIEEHGITDALLVPTMVQMLLACPDLSKFDLSSMRRIVYGASPMPLATIDLCQDLLPSVELTQAYGMTELSPLATISGPENHSAAGRENGRIRCAGRAGYLQEVKIVNDDNQEVPIGDVGEVIVRGPNVMLGYWNKPEVTEEAVVDGWMHTGDGGYMDKEGYVYIVDRIKDMVITGGENVYSAEVESVLSQHPNVQQCAIIGIPSEEWGELVHAVIVPTPGSEPTLESVRDFCREKIAGYKCPRSVSFVEVMPLSGAGKVLKTELRKPYWQNSAKGVS